MGWDANGILDSVYDVLLSTVREVSPDDMYLQALVSVLKRARQAERKPRASFTLLPVLSCMACGGVEERAIPVAAAWRALHIAAHLLDEVEDAVQASLPIRELSPALTINTATGLLALAGLALAHMSDGEDKINKQVPFSLFYQTVFRAAGGQHLELSLDTFPDLDTYFRIAALKSGEPFALAAQSGALVAGANGEAVVRCKTFGYNVGILIQLLDDWRDFMTDVLVEEGCPLPVVYAFAVASPDLSRRLAEAWERRDEEVEARKVRDLVQGLGGLTYTLGEMFRYFERAWAILAEMDGAELLREWLLEVTSGTPLALHRKM